MTLHVSDRFARRIVTLSLAVIFACSPLVTLHVSARQDEPQITDDAARVNVSPFRMERRPVNGGAELLTIFGNLVGVDDDDESPAVESVPLVSVLRDTLGDETPENDRLRYVWMLSYTRPSPGKRIASAIPFLYRRVGDKRRVPTDGMPPPVIDLAATDRDVWYRFMLAALRNIIINPYGSVAQTSAGSFRRNQTQYRQAHIMRALAILSLYEAETGTRSAFTYEETREIQARLALADQTFGGIVNDHFLDRARRQQETHWLDTRGHNWEMLRQRAEVEGLYFEPLTMPDGGATHALVWVAREDIMGRNGRRFDSRFLNISNPWNDSRLRNWNGFTETWHLDEESRIVPPETEGARAVEMIPLALYGLEHPRVPTLLIDFRNTSNPKRREASRLIIEDVSRNLLSTTPLGGLHFVLGRLVFDFVTSRRGMDINQPSRMRAYSQLKLLLSLDTSLDPAFREELGRRIERVSTNPLENGVETEAQIARQQYEALVAYAERPGGMPARLDRQRRAELVAANHGRAERVLFRFANVLSLGIYKHREGMPRDEMMVALNRERGAAYHTRFLREVVDSGPVIEVTWDIERVRQSLRHLSRATGRYDERAARLAGRVFAQTADDQTRKLSLECLHQINNEAARRELLNIQELDGLTPELRELTDRYIRDAARTERKTNPAARTAAPGL